MAETFTIGAGGLTKMQATLARFAPEARAMVAEGLNELAFLFRKQAPEVLAQKRTIRDPRFVASRFYVQKADPKAQLSKMFARAGSIKSERFSGWAEDYGEAQGKGRAARAIGSIGRGGSMESKALTKSRLRPGQSYPKPDQFAGKTWNAKVAMMISMVARGKFGNPNQPFILYGHHWRPGLYRINAQSMKFVKAANRKKQRGSLAQSILRFPPVERLQTFGANKSHTKFDWAHIAQQKGLSEQDRIWANAFRHFEAYHH